MTGFSSPDPHKRTLLRRVREFIALETTAGFALVFAAALGMIVANSALAPYYHGVLNNVNFTVGLTESAGQSYFALSKSILLWVNDGMMTVFFFLVGLEIKREFKEGQLATRAQGILPLLAALGGMAMPALIFLYFTRDHPELQHGWAIPSATDTAFALGVIALLGSRVPLSLKILVMAIAVIDDIGAIAVIAIFYAHELFLPAFMFAGAIMILMITMNRLEVWRPAAYVLTGFILWTAVLESGAHATLAGVLTAMCVPMHSKRNPHYHTCEHLIETLHPWVAFLILPIFAFANAGVPLDGISATTFTDPVVLGIMFGLFIGKQIGIFGTVWGLVKLGVSPKPEGATWAQIYGVAILCGIGFTMSLFIGALAYTSTAMQVDVRLGVMMGSLLSAFTGYFLLKYLGKRAS